MRILLRWRGEPLDRRRHLERRLWGVRGLQIGARCKLTCLLRIRQHLSEPGHAWHCLLHSSVHDVLLALLAVLEILFPLGCYQNAKDGDKAVAGYINRKRDLHYLLQYLYLRVCRHLADPGARGPPSKLMLTQRDASVAGMGVSSVFARCARMIFVVHRAFR